MDGWTRFSRPAPQGVCKFNCTLIAVDCQMRYGALILTVQIPEAVDVQGNNYYATKLMSQRLLQTIIYVMDWNRNEIPWVWLIDRA